MRLIWIDEDDIHYDPLLGPENTDELQSLLRRGSCFVSAGGCWFASAVSVRVSSTVRLNALISFISCESSRSSSLSIALSKRRSFVFLLILLWKQSQ